MVDRVLDHERDGDGLAMIEAEIRSIPPDLYRLYRELLRGMTSDSLKLVQWICFATRPLSLEELRWVMVIDADCPCKSLRECQNAGDFPSTLDMVETRLKRLTCGLAEAVPSYKTKVVQFIHQSVRDFFIDQGLSILTGSSKWIAHCIRQSARDLPKTLEGVFVESSLSVLQASPNISATLIGFATAFMLYVDYFIRGQRSLLPDRAFPLPTVLAIISAFWLHEASIRAAKAKFAVGTAHYRLSRMCLRYLAMEDIPLLTSDNSYGLQSQFPMLHYATTTWVAHVQQSEENGIFQGDLLGFFSWPSEALLHRWVRFHHIMVSWVRDCPSEGMGMIHMVSAYRLMGPLQMLFHNAAKTGTIVDEKDGNGRTPLSWAASRGHEALVQQLLDRGANINTADEKGCTPLIYATLFDNKAMVKLLLDQGANINTADEKGCTPLIYATTSKNETMVKLLLDQGAKVDMADESGQTPLHISARNRNGVIAQQLLERGANVNVANESGLTPLHTAAEFGNEAVVQLLLEGGAKVDVVGDGVGTPLLSAVERGDVAMVQMLLGRRADVQISDQWGQTPLMLAVKNEDEAIMQMLLDQGADVDRRDDYGWTALMYATKWRDNDILQMLLD